MFCFNCGKPLPEGSKFCFYCGMEEPEYTPYSELVKAAPVPEAKPVPVFVPQPAQPMAEEPAVAPAPMAMPVAAPVIEPVTAPEPAPVSEPEVKAAPTAEAATASAPAPAPISEPQTIEMPVAAAVPQAPAAEPEATEDPHKKSPEKSSKKSLSDLSAGAVIGIVLGAFVLTVALLSAIFLLPNRKPAAVEEAPVQTETVITEDAAATAEAVEEQIPQIIVPAPHYFLYMQHEVPEGATEFEFIFDTDPHRYAQYYVDVICDYYGLVLMDSDRTDHGYAWQLEMPDMENTRMTVGYEQEGTGYRLYFDFTETFAFVDAEVYDPNAAAEAPSYGGTVVAPELLAAFNFEGEPTEEHLLFVDQGAPLTFLVTGENREERCLRFVEYIAHAADLTFDVDTYGEYPQERFVVYSIREDSGAVEPAMAWYEFGSSMEYFEGAMLIALDFSDGQTARITVVYSPQLHIADMGAVVDTVNEVDINLIPEFCR